MDQENKGKVKHVSDKGFGFLTIEGRGNDLFFHAKSLIDVDFASLQIDDMVSFEGIKDSSRGEVAVGVRLVK